MSVPRWLGRLPFPTPLKHVAGSAWMMAGRLFALGSIAAFGLAIFIGALSAIDSVFEGRDQWYAEGHLADVELRVVADDVANFPRFDDIPGLAGHRLRMLYPGSLSTRTNDALRVILIAPASDNLARSVPINQPTLLEGRALEAGDRDGAVIDRSLAAYHGIKPGDTLKLKLGTENLSLTVRGVVLDPEFLLAPSNPSLFVPSKGSLGILHVNPELLRERFGFTPANSVLVRAAPGADLPALRQAVQQRAATRLNVDATTLRDEQFSYQFLEKDLGVFRIVIPVIVLVSALSAIVVTVFLFAQWVLRERQVIGVFMALGHSWSSLSTAFALMFLYLAAGAVMGGVGGALVVGQGFLKNFTEAIGLPLPPLVLGPGYILWGTVGVLVIFALAGAFAVRRVFLLSPLDAMRNPVAQAGAPGKLAGLLGQLLPATWLRVPVRNLFRSGRLSLVTILCVGLGFGITSAFFISFSSFVGTSVKQVEKDSWHLAVDFVAPVWNENVDDMVSLPGMADYAPYTKGVAQAVRDGQRRNLYIGGFDPARPWHAVALVEGSDLSEREPNGIVLEQSSARELGVKPGDTLTLETQGRTRQALIVGLFSGAMPGEARLPIAFHRDLADLEDRSTGLFIRVMGDPAPLVRQLSAIADVQQVLSRQQVADEILAASGQVTAIIELGAVVSIAIASLFVFACLGYTVLQRQGEYQSLRLLGYSDALIRAIVVVEICLVGAAALMVAVPVGALTAGYLNGKLSEAWFQVDTIITLKDYLKTFVPSFILLPIVALPIARMILREPLFTHLRSRDIA